MIGCCCVILGLTNPEAQKHNGKKCVVKHVYPLDQKADVELETSEVVKLKFEKLLPVSKDDETSVPTAATAPPVTPTAATAPPVTPTVTTPPVTPTLETPPAKKIRVSNPALVLIYLL